MRSYDRNPKLFPFGSGIELPDPIELLTIAAVREMLARPNADAFLEWMRIRGPEEHPGVFARFLLPEVGTSFATNLGIALWNAMPLPDNGFRPDPLPPPQALAPCRCHSGRTYGRCCANMPAAPLFTSARLWRVVVRVLEEEDLIAAAASLQIPGDLLLELADCWRRCQLYELVLKVLEPVFRKLPKVLAAPPYRNPPVIRDVLEPLLEVFVDSLMQVGGAAKERRWRRILLAELPAKLHHAVRLHLLPDLEIVDGVDGARCRT